MALPFILGLAVGVGVVTAFNKSDKLKNRLVQVLEKSKDLANDSFEKGKEIACDVRNNIKATCSKEKNLKEEAEDEKVEEELKVEPVVKKRVRKIKPKEE